MNPKKESLSDEATKVLGEMQRDAGEPRAFSISFIQRRLKYGYHHAIDIANELAERELIEFRSNQEIILRQPTSATTELMNDEAYLYWKDINRLGERGECVGRAFDTHDAKTIAASVNYALATAQRSATTDAVLSHFTEEERDAILELGKIQYLSPIQVLRCGLRGYQIRVKGEPNLGPKAPPKTAAGEALDYDRSIHSNPDAQAWAQFFCETAKELIHEGRDPQELLMDCPWMLSWFANAMMAMHDFMQQNGWKKIEQDADAGEARIEEIAKHAGNEAATYYWQEENRSLKTVRVTVEGACIRAARAAIRAALSATDAAEQICPDCKEAFTGDAGLDHEIHGRCSSQGIPAADLGGRNTDAT